MCESAYHTCFCVCAYTHCLCVHTDSCSAVELHRCGSGWAKRSKEWKWRQMNRDELNTLPVSSILLITTPPPPPSPPPAFFFLPFPCSPGENITKPHRKTPGTVMKSAKAWHFLCYFSRHWQLIPQRWLAGARSAIILTLKAAVHGRAYKYESPSGAFPQSIPYVYLSAPCVCDYIMWVYGLGGTS